MEDDFEEDADCDDEPPELEVDEVAVVDAAGGCSGVGVGRDPFRRILSHVASTEPVRDKSNSMAATGI